MEIKFLPQLSQEMHYIPVKWRLKIPKFDETAVFLVALHFPCKSKSSNIIVSFSPLIVSYIMYMDVKVNNEIFFYLIFHAKNNMYNAFINAFTCYPFQPNDSFSRISALDIYNTLKEERRIRLSGLARNYAFLLSDSGCYRCSISISFYEKRWGAGWKCIIMTKCNWQCPIYFLCIWTIENLRLLAAIN